MATKDTNYLVAVHKGLDESLEKQVAALPEKFNKQRFLQNCMTVLQDGQADFSKCEAPTVVRTLLKGAFLGLDFFNGECYAIPYGNQCQFQTDYKGEIKLCKRYSSNPIQDIYAKVVREGDEFEEVIESGKQYVNFRPKTFSNGEIIGAFAVVLYKDGSMMYDTMSKEDIEHTRQTFSKAANSKGYKCYTQILNAKDYGVAQNRERCFMVSILGDYNYKFPQPIPLDKTMKDYLEDEVDEKYYINSEKAQKLIKDLRESGQLDGISKTVRGGRGSVDRHHWDAVLQK